MKLKGGMWLLATLAPGWHSPMLSSLAAMQCKSDAECATSMVANGDYPFCAGGVCSQCRVLNGVDQGDCTSEDEPVCLPTVTSDDGMDGGICVECNDDSHCDAGSDKPFCNTNLHNCVECLTYEDCDFHNGNTDSCNKDEDTGGCFAQAVCKKCSVDTPCWQSSNNRCGECLDNKDCRPSLGPYTGSGCPDRFCDTSGATNKCIECTNDDHCNTQLAGNCFPLDGPHCTRDGLCRTCLRDEHCGVKKPRCDSDWVCKECLTNGDCHFFGGTCQNNQCVCTQDSDCEHHQSGVAKCQNGKCVGTKIQLKSDKGWPYDVKLIVTCDKGDGAFNEANPREKTDQIDSGPGVHQGSVTFQHDCTGGIRVKLQDWDSGWDTYKYAMVEDSYPFNLNNAPESSSAIVGRDNYDGFIGRNGFSSFDGLEGWPNGDGSSLRDSRTAEAQFLRFHRTDNNFAPLNDFLCIRLYGLGATANYAVKLKWCSCDDGEEAQCPDVDGDRFPYCRGGKCCNSNNQCITPTWT